MSNDIYDRRRIDPVPPSKFLKMGAHHWLEVIDCDGHSFGLVVAQWAPSAKKWCHSGNLGSGMYLNTMYWRYHSHCPMPE
jgi:hypothetical protein